MPIVDVDESTQDVDEETVASPDLVGFAGEKIFVRLSVTSDAAELRDIESKPFLIGRGKIFVFARNRLFWSRSR
jgi:hypothetical protein